MKSMLLIITAVMMLAGLALAQAQNTGPGTGYTIVTPGAPPTFVNPSFNGGYTAITPGAPPTFINPSFNGGYTIMTPGKPLTFVNPTMPSYSSAPDFGGDDSDDP